MRISYGISIELSLQVRDFTGVVGGFIGSKRAVRLPYIALNYDTRSVCRASGFRSNGVLFTDVYAADYSQQLLVPPVILREYVGVASGSGMAGARPVAAKYRQIHPGLSIA
jgi:hypothetical protein